ncbi:hypothetical protein [Cyclobacterium jeungdonense]|uniref:Uncharacterized protein n=1 Tax=Cyclobacterium jeungdonense TaxID=708087 RepID=A0ABT8C901_9BACT|nr:hypothetical protein [Cyclobacterium jeungdonense]MDN3688612.1 hypothetical protein [Cyclobacterium jeungdonense]
MENKRNRIKELTLEQVLGIKHNHAKDLFKLGYYKIIDIMAFDAEGYGPYLPERFQATAYFRKSPNEEYSNEIEQLDRLNPLLNLVAKHNLVEIGMGKPQKSLDYFQKIAAIGEIRIIEITRGESYEIEWELIPF